MFSARLVDVVLLHSTLSGKILPKLSSVLACPLACFLQKGMILQELFVDSKANSLGAMHSEALVY